MNTSGLCKLRKAHYFCFFRNNTLISHSELFKMPKILKILKLYFLVVCILIINACSITRLNINHRTPRNPFKYPVFTLKDTLRGQLNRFRSCYDVTFYNLNVDFNFNEKVPFQGLRIFILML